MKHMTEHISLLLRDLEAEIGTRDVSYLVLRALKDSIRNFSGRCFKDFCEQFKNLSHCVENTEPKFGILIYHFKGLICALEKEGYEQLHNCDWKKSLVKHIDHILKGMKNQCNDLIKYADEIDVEGKTILIHDHSHTVQDALVHYRRQGKNFRVVIAEQDFDKTHGNIERMHSAGISFQVVPAYMLSHVHDRIDMLFFGALTLKDNMQFVMDPGTHGIISEFHVANTPVYMFIDVNKFSLWKSRPRGEIFIHEHLREHHTKDIKYSRIKYSHDRVPADLFTKIITNEGVMDVEGLKKLFKKRMEECSG